MEVEYKTSNDSLPPNHDQIYIPNVKAPSVDTFVEIAMEAVKDIPDHVYDFKSEDLTKAYNIGVELYNGFIDQVDTPAEEIELEKVIEDQISSTDASSVTVPITKAVKDKNYFSGFAFGLVSVAESVRSKSKVIPHLSLFKDKIEMQLKVMKKKSVENSVIQRKWSEAYEGRRNELQPFTIPGCVFPAEWAVSFRNKAYHIVESSPIDLSEISSAKAEAESVPVVNTTENKTPSQKSDVVSGLLTGGDTKKQDPTSQANKDPRNFTTVIMFKSADWNNGKTVVWPYMLVDNFFNAADTDVKSRLDRFRMLASIYNLNNLASKSVSLTDLVSTPVNNKIFPSGVKVPGEVKWNQALYKTRQASYLKDPNFVNQMKTDWRKFIADIRKGVVA